MIKVASFLMLGIAAVFFLVAFAFQPDKESQLLDIVLPAMHDFGSIRIGQSVSVNIVIDNATDATANIVSIKKSCGCATAEASDTVIPGRSKGRLVVGLRPTTRRGRIAESVVVEYSLGGITHAHAIKLIVYVAPEIVIAPESIEFTRSAGVQTATIRFSSTNSSALRILGASSSHLSIKATVFEDKTSATISFDPSCVGWESGRLIVVFVSDNPIEPEIQVPVVII